MHGVTKGEPRAKHSKPKNTCLLTRLTTGFLYAFTLLSVQTLYNNKVYLFRFIFNLQEIGAIMSKKQYKPKELSDIYSKKYSDSINCTECSFTKLF